ncbi:MAG: RDD family protein [Cyclobacteriaceae bacterium]
MNDNQVLDQQQSIEQKGEDYVQQKMAGGGKRFANFIIDTIVYFILYAVVSLKVYEQIQSEYEAEIAGETIDSTTGTFAIIAFIVLMAFVFLYPWVMETLTGKTIGKYITRTKIIKPDGSKPTAINILGRTLCRFIPFDVFRAIWEGIRAGMTVFLRSML